MSSADRWKWLRELQEERKKNGVAAMPCSTASLSSLSRSPIPDLVPGVQLLANSISEQSRSRSEMIAAGRAEREKKQAAKEYRKRSRADHKRMEQEHAMKAQEQAMKAQDAMMAMFQQQQAFMLQQQEEKKVFFTMMQQQMEMMKEMKDNLKK